MKEVCGCKLKKMAVWVYMPGYSNPDANDYSCEDCVNRGCGCNWESTIGDEYNPGGTQPEGVENKDWRWITDEDRKKEGMDNPIEEKKYWIYLDEEGRESPCCEYSYSKEGWDAGEEPIVQLYGKRIVDENGDNIIV